MTNFIQTIRYLFPETENPHKQKIIDLIYEIYKDDKTDPFILNVRIEFYYSIYFCSILYGLPHQEKYSLFCEEKCLFNTNTIYHNTLFLGGSISYGSINNICDYRIIMTINGFILQRRNGVGIVEVNKIKKIKNSRFNDMETIYKTHNESLEDIENPWINVPLNEPLTNFIRIN